MEKMNVNEQNETKEPIDMLAGKIYETLNEKQELSFEQIIKFVPANSTEIFHSLRLLAHNNKIVFQTIGDTTFIKVT